MEKITTLLESVLTEQEAIKTQLHELSENNEGNRVIEHYLRRLPELQRHLKMFHRELKENLYDYESKLKRLEKNIEKQTYISGKLDKEVERKREIVDLIHSDFEKTKERELKDIDEELRKYRMDAAQAMLTEFDQVAIAERDVRTLADLLKRITSYRRHDEAIRSRFMKILIEVLENKMDTQQKDLFAAISNESDKNTKDLHEQFDLVEKVSKEMEKRIDFMRNLYNIRKQQKEEKMNKLYEEETRKRNHLYQA